MFPTDAISITQNLNGAGNVVLASSTRTILAISVQKENASKLTSVLCNSTIVSENYSNITLFWQPIQYVCNGTLTMQTTGVGNSSFIITYVNRDISVNNFSSGDVMTIMLLILIFSAFVFATMKSWIFGTKIDGFTKVVNAKTMKI
jgi:hypothetical protein